MIKVIKIKTDEAKLIETALEHNDGYCPCAMVKNKDTKCMCKEFRESKITGDCHCGLYHKEVTE